MTRDETLGLAGGEQMGLTTDADAAVVTAGEIAGIVGAAHVRRATTVDAVAGMMPRLVAAPGTVEEVAALMRVASRMDLAVAPRGAGTTLGLGNAPSRLDLVVSLHRLDRILEHAAGDLVVRAEAGTPISTLRHAVGHAGQMLALDPPEATRGATLGGIVAADLAGPRRLRYGTVRDLLIGVTVVLADGTVAKAGGKVVKNVAGYDLCKVFTRSLGTLGIVVETIFRLHPLPAAHGTVSVTLEDSASACTAVGALLRSALVPSAIEMGWGDGWGTLAVLFEGVAPGVDAQCARAVELLTPFGQGTIVPPDEEQHLWADLAVPPWWGDPAGGKPDGIGLKIAAPPAALGTVLDDLAGFAAALPDVPLGIRGHAGTGVTYVGMPFDLAADVDMALLAGLVHDLRHRAMARGGSLVVVNGPAAFANEIDAWGPPGDTADLARAVKQRFDPSGILNPGRYVGGI